MFKNKVIRDAVHGDIIIQEKYIKIIDTPEFQRLRRIKQLSVGNFAFPGAEHTRFSHSIGTFYITSKIIEHFDGIFNSIQIDTISEKEKEITLLAALLHDIGHGPFSHTFEEVLSNQGCELKHEQRSIDIILYKSSMINKVLCDEFGEDYPERVANTINNKRIIKEQGFKKYSTKPNLQFVLSSLISSQLDADRMDYLLRDAMFTGVKFGDIDLSRIISSMTINVNNSTNEFCVCVKSKYLSDIESYLAGRYQMNKIVYYHSLKCQMELIVEKILMRARKLYNENKLEQSNIPKAFQNLFKGREIDIAEYLSLDDNIMYSSFMVWKESKDVELSFLCNAILNRRKYKKIPIIVSKSHDYISDFKNELEEIFNTYNYHIKLSDESFFLENTDKYNLYKITKDNIYVLDQFGILRDIIDESKLINISIKENKKTVYISFELLKKIFCKDDNVKMLDEIKNLIQKYDTRNHIEIEKKYFINDESKVQNVIDVVKSIKNYKVAKQDSNKKQIDYYYDTKDYFLENNNITLRIRERDNKYEMTIKTPVTKNDNNEILQNERFEHEYQVDSNDINKYKKIINKHINSDIISNLKETLIVKNNRTKYNILDSNKEKIIFEMVYDDVEYQNIYSNKIATDKQIEIELKAEYEYAVNLKILTDQINKEVSNLIEDISSKYKRGLSLTR